MSAHTADQIVHHDAPSDMKAKIWRTFWILLVLTLVDIAFYFIFPPSTYRNWLFIVLGIVKAYFIVSIFMHMKFEKKFLAWMIVLPMSFVVYLITLMIIEGGYTDDSRNKNDGNTPVKKTEQHDNHSGH